MSLGKQAYTHFSTLRLAGPPGGEPKGSDTITGAGAINPDTLVTAVVTTGADALTLADGEVPGQVKVIYMKTDGGDGTLTPATFIGGTTITFDAVGDTVTLLWQTEGWYVIGINGAVVA